MVRQDSVDKGQQGVRYGFPTAVSGDAAEDHPSKDQDGPKSPAILRWLKPEVLMQTVGKWGYPWTGWAFVYGLVLLVFFIYRCTALKDLFAMYASVKDGTPGVVLGALTLGLLEDFVCATYFACALWAFDTAKAATMMCLPQLARLWISQLVCKLVTFLASWLLFLAMTIPFVADVIIVRLRDMRFTFDIVTMAIDEKDNATAFEVSNGEIAEAVLNAVALVVVATGFAVVRTWAPWADLSSWNPTQMVLLFVDSQARYSLCSGRSTRVKHKHRPSAKVNQDDSEDSQDSSSPTEDSELDPSNILSSRAKTNKIRGGDDEDEHRNAAKTAQYVKLEIREGADSPELRKLKAVDEDDDDNSMDSNPMDQYRQYLKRGIITLVGLVLFPVVVVAISRGSTPLVAYSALNTTLNELFKHALQPHVRQITPSAKDTSLPWVEVFIDYKTEEHELFGNDTLYRRTTGFKGDLAFDVDVTGENPPNVLVIVVEAFRFHDSHYLVGEKDPSNLFKGSNITITPNFDKWAKRGIALRNFWSSWRTSRSVESIQFAQLPYDSVTKSGMSGGRRETKLAGLPQLFTAKGYETFFTTGCLTGYDQWDTFLPSHGFDTVWSRDEMKVIAENDLGIKHEDWDGAEHRALNWGVHDDLSFQILGDLMVNKTKEQADRVARGEPKKPLYLNHYTISSHVDYKQRPKWYDESEKPDFSVMYEGEEFADNIKNYLEMRYFADVEMGKFLDRMAKEGILNDTIIVISGDHGQGPEFGNDVPEDRDVSATRVAGAIIAEGRLGNASGMVIDDATEQYDILNTLADITGVPEGGFEQDGVGRSLKRKMQFGERTVYSNNPTRKMSVVRGHLRLRYDKVTNSMLLHDADTDHDMKNDLLPDLTSDEREEWVAWRDAGRRINSYYTKRWEGSCLLEAEC
ncbi:sulfatase-like protein [Phytophthora cinnamomi]|uniref:sulfatase-like protein n=1 Tax=Phytophthora cinnamomi TaxID=4785 RepID=UPI003559EC77|nr:sulfatase-like protein [Phytophthora cinnamomi]